MLRIFVLGIMFMASFSVADDLNARRSAERDVLNLIRDRVTGPELRRKVIHLIGAIQRTPLPGDPSRAQLGELLKLSRASQAELHPRYRPLVITAAQSAELNQLLADEPSQDKARSWITPGNLAQLKTALREGSNSTQRASMAGQTKRNLLAHAPSKEYQALPPVHPAVRWLLATLGMLVFVRMIFGRHTSS